MVANIGSVVFFVTTAVVMAGAGFVMWKNGQDGPRPGARPEE